MTNGRASPIPTAPRIRRFVIDAWTHCRPRQQIYARMRMLVDGLRVPQNGASARVMGTSFAANSGIRDSLNHCVATRVANRLTVQS
jgi:hypothetical protein